MITVSHRSACSPERVWAVIADGWSYAGWVVGACRVRAVTADWPAVGARIHHSVGAWPLVLDDETQVLRSQPGRLVRLLARTRPFGEAFVEVELTAKDGGTLIEMREDATRGPARLVPMPVRQASLVPRNRETVHRLALLAERAILPSPGGRSCSQPQPGRE